MNGSVAATLLGPNEVLVAKGVVAEQEREALVDWLAAQRRADKLVRNPKDPGAYSTPFRAADGGLTRLIQPGASTDKGPSPVWLPNVNPTPEPLPDTLWRIRDRVIDRLGLDDLDDDPYKGTFMSYIEPGTGVHQHRDERILVDAEERPILRCNIFLRRPAGGGLPVFDGRLELDVPDRGLWAFFPSELVHSATAVRGPGIRALLSLGFLARVEHWWHRRFRVAPDFVTEYGLGSELAREKLLDRLAGTGVGRCQLALLGFALSTPGGFSIAEAAEPLSMDAQALWPMVRDLQRNRVLDSESSMVSKRGKVWVT